MVQDIENDQRERVRNAREKNLLTIRSEEEVLNDIKRCGLDDPSEKSLWNELRKIRAANKMILDEI